MRVRVTLAGKQLDMNQYCDVIEGLVSKNFKPIIDPRKFDAPLTIKARFKVDDNKIRFIELSPSLELSMEHIGTQAQASAKLKAVQKHVEEVLITGSVKPEDFELATLQMISRRNPVITPKSEAEEKLFRSLVDKKIFSVATALQCPECTQSFMLPKKHLPIGEKAFCSDCEKWFEVKKTVDSYILNEDYMEVMGGMWNKMQKLIKSSWREIMKRGVPMIPKP